MIKLLMQKAQEKNNILLFL